MQGRSNYTVLRSHLMSAADPFQNRYLSSSSSVARLMVIEPFLFRDITLVPSVSCIVIVWWVVALDVFELFAAR